MQLDAATAVVIGAASGALVSGVSNFITRWLDRTAENRKHYRELSIQAAISAWEHHIELQKLRGELLQEHVTILPLDTFIVRMVRLLEIAADTSLKPSELTKRMNSLKPIDDAMLKAASPKHEAGLAQSLRPTTEQNQDTKRFHYAPQFFRSASPAIVHAYGNLY